MKRLLLGHQPKSFRVAVLLDKPSRRKLAVEADYIGFTIPDEFVVGYGLDYAETIPQSVRIFACCPTSSAGLANKMNPVSQQRGPMPNMDNSRSSSWLI